MDKFLNVIQACCVMTGVLFLGYLMLYMPIVIPNVFLYAESILVVGYCLIKLYHYFSSNEKE